MIKCKYNSLKNQHQVEEMDTAKYVFTQPL